MNTALVDLLGMVLGDFKGIILEEYVSEGETVNRAVGMP